ncbi:MAG: TetR/AcrR family transcriptional regulator C-terminal domain-containing protein [Dermatophilaceae bacterium]
MTTNPVKPAVTVASPACMTRRPPHLVPSGWLATKPSTMPTAWGIPASPAVSGDQPGPTCTSRVKTMDRPVSPPLRHSLSLYVAADAFEGWMMGRIFDDGSGRPPEAVGREYFAQFGERIAALPADRFPHLVAMVGAMTTGGGDERFAFGIDTFIAGLAARAGEAP